MAAYPVEGFSPSPFKNLTANAVAPEIAPEMARIALRFGLLIEHHKHGLVSFIELCFSVRHDLELQGHVSEREIARPKLRGRNCPENRGRLRMLGTVLWGFPFWSPQDKPSRITVKSTPQVSEIASVSDNSPSPGPVALLIAGTHIAKIRPKIVRPPG